MGQQGSHLYARDSTPGMNLPLARTQEDELDASWFASVKNRTRLLHLSNGLVKSQGHLFINSSILL